MTNIEEIWARHEEVELALELELQTFGLRSQEAHADRATLLRALDEAQEELSIWQSVFPDIAPDRVLPDRSRLEAELLALTEENARLREAIEELAQLARAALKETEDDH